MNHSIDQTKCRSFSATTNPLFFKVLLPGFRRRLSIPPKFARKHLAHVNRNRNRAIIKSPLGKSWNVYVHVNEEGYFFKKGWRRFAQDHELCSKDLLVFEYEGCLRFSVKLFDSCACEKEYTPSFRNGVEECESMIEIFEPSTNSPSGCPKQGLLNDEHRLKLTKWTTENFHVYSRNGISFFKTTIRQINISRSYMWIPPKFSAISGFQYRQEITMRDPRGREWQMKVFHHGTREKHDEFCGEWRNLVRVNALEVGDICIFEFNPNRKDVIDVHMVKKQSESYHCRKETPLSVPKTEVKQIPSTCLKRQASYEESEDTLKKRMRNSSQSSGSACLSRFPSFKITITSSKLIESYVSIPGDFVELNGLQNGSCVMLRDPKGGLWQVKLYHGFRNKNWSQLQGQWHEFVIANELRSGDICVFKLIIGEKNHILDVCILNGLSAIKRIFSPVQNGSKECKILSETGCSTQGSSDSECKIKSSKKTKRTRKRNTNGVYRKNGISFFESTIKPANISYPYMWIPPKFADLNGFRNIREIMIRDPRCRLWHMKICHRNRRNERSFYGGWLKFTQVNGLEVGDVCVFEYNPYREKNIMDVHIVKKQSEPKPREETPYPAQRMTEKCEIGTKFENPIPNASFGQSEVELISIQGSGLVCSKHLPSFEISIKPSNLVESYMSIPGEFVELNGLQNGSQVMLRDPKGSLWEVQIYHWFRNKAWSQLRGKWHQFIIANGLQIGDICIFKLIIGGKKDIFDVSILKGQPVTREFSPIQNDSALCKPQSEVGKLSGNCPNGFESLEGMKLQIEAAKCPRRNDAIEMNGWFTTSMKQYNIHKTYMYIPAKFAASNGFQNRNRVMLRDPVGRPWEIQIFHFQGKNVSHFCGEWRQFVIANGLKAGDTCMFKLISDGDDVMDVCIIKNQSDACQNSTGSCKIEGITDEHSADNSKGTPLPSPVGESYPEECALHLDGPPMNQKRHPIKESKTFASMKCPS